MKPDEPARRGPWMSEIMIAVSRTRDLSIPSARIRAFIAASIRSAEEAEAAGDAADPAAAPPVAQAAKPEAQSNNETPRKGDATDATAGRPCIVICFE
ncbi:MAG: hypothetical protein H0T48_10160 [Gemmatimonadaceae bacterium]|nr:hypothetical protein [Gemmatimonadaceae bacterium]